MLTDTINYYAKSLAAIFKVKLMLVYGIYMNVSQLLVLLVLDDQKLNSSTILTCTGSF